MEGRQPFQRSRRRPAGRRSGGGGSGVGNSAPNPAERPAAAGAGLRPFCATRAGPGDAARGARLPFFLFGIRADPGQGSRRSGVQAVGTEPGSSLTDTLPERRARVCRGSRPGGPVPPGSDQGVCWARSFLGRSFFSAAQGCGDKHRGKRKQIDQRRCLCRPWRFISCPSLRRYGFRIWVSAWMLVIGNSPSRPACRAEGFRDGQGISASASTTWPGFPEQARSPAPGLGRSPALFRLAWKRRCRFGLIGLVVSATLAPTSMSAMSMEWISRAVPAP